MTGDGLERGVPFEYIRTGQDDSVSMVLLHVLEISTEVRIYVDTEVVEGKSASCR